MPTTTVINKGQRGVDYAYLGSKTKAAIEATLGKPNPVMFAGRYVAKGGKGLTVAERDWLWSLGIGISPIKEHATKDALGGYTRGFQLASEVLDEIENLPAWQGLPKNVPVVFCADTDITAVTARVAGEFFRGARDRMSTAGRTVIGGYVDEDAYQGAAEAGVTLNPTCLPGALGWSPVWFRRMKAGLPWTWTPTMVQKLDQANSIDWLYVYAPAIVWLPTPDPKPEPQIPGPISTLPPVDRPVLSRGSTGMWVAYAQRVVSIVNGHKIAVDGKFGRQTEREIRSFQTARRLVVDGVVGPQTWAALELARNTVNSRHPASGR